jgi:rRNA processing protein Gar1
MRGGNRRLGVVENIAHDGSLLVRSEFAPARGAEVLDRRNRPLGRVTRVFGPVKEPFASVRPAVPAAPSLVGADVFVGEGKHAHEEDRRSRRSH